MIYEKTETFTVKYYGKEEKITFGFNSKPFWSAVKISGNSPMGNCSGGEYKTMQEYIQSIKKNLEYACSFFSDGYKAAKQNYAQ